MVPSSHLQIAELRPAGHLWILDEFHRGVVPQERRRPRAKVEAATATGGQEEGLKRKEGR